METFKNYYRTLNVDSTADDAAIKAAFRRLARRHHPDVAKTARAARRFPEIREAYEVLSDPERRRQYDQLYRARTAERPLTGGAGVGITLDVLGLRLGFAVDTAARRGAGSNPSPRSQRKKR